MAPRKPKANKEVAVVVQPTQVADIEPRTTPVVTEGDPEQQLAFASKAASALMSVVNKKPKKVMIQGKQYLEFGDWQTLARFFGATVGTEWTKPLTRNGEIYGYEARAVVTHNGEVISSAEGMCTRDEKKWFKADDYAIKSMAQTRTGAKALRNAYGWVAELAGYSSTPAEEMDGVVDRNDQPFPSRPSPSAPAAQNIPPTKKQTIGRQLIELGHPLATMGKSEADAAVKKHTGLDPNDTENHDEIINRLNFAIQEKREWGEHAAENPSSTDIT